MKLIQIDVICTQPAEAVFARFDQMFPGPAEIVLARSHTEIGLCRNQHLAASRTECFAENLFGLTVGVGVRGVEQVDARLDTYVNDTRCFREFVRSEFPEQLNITAAKSSCSKTQRRDAKT
jgi:hypothetical protein